MKCAEYRKQTVGLFAESKELSKHASTCGDCQQFLKTHLVIRAAFRNVAIKAQTAVQNDKTAALLLAEFDRVVAEKKRPVQIGPHLRFAVAIACSICLLMAAVFIFRQRSPGHQTKTAGIGRDEQFAAVPYVVPLATYERVEVVRMRVSLAALASLGFEVHGPDVSGSVMADVECGEDGRVVAISLLQDSRVKVDRRVN
jgi:hypothetical protein